MIAMRAATARWLMFLLVSLVTVAVEAEEYTMNIGEAAVRFPMDGRYVPFCSNPRAAAALEKTFPKTMRVVQCFFTVDSVNQMKRGLRSEDELMIVVAMSEEFGSRPLTQEQWTKKKLVIESAMPREGAQAEVSRPESTGNPINAMVGDGSSTEHVFDETPLSVSIEEQENEVLAGRNHVTLLADVIADNRMIMILAVRSYAKGNRSEVVSSLKKEFAQLVARTVALNPSDLGTVHTAR